VNTEPEHTVLGPGLTIPLTADDAHVLGDDAELLAALLGQALHGIALLRAGRASVEDLTEAIERTTELMERLNGIRRAEVREFAAQKGTHGALARAMHLTSRATAQSRRRALLREVPDVMEEWAVGEQDWRQEPDWRQD
jgi:phage gpG-like protein